MIDEGFRKNDHGGPPRPARRSAHPPLPLHRRHPAALRGHVGRAGRPLLPRRGVSRGGERPARGRARHVRSRPTSSTRAGKLMILKLREDYKAQAGRQVLAARLPRHAARQRHRADLAAPRADARRAERATCSSSRTRDAESRSILRIATVMPLYEYQCEACSTVSRRSRSSPIRRSRPARSAAGPVQKLISSPAIQFKGSAGTSPTTRRSRRPTAAVGVGASRRLREVREVRQEREVGEVRSKTESRSRRQVGLVDSSDLGGRDVEDRVVLEPQPDAQPTLPRSTRRVRDRSLAGSRGTAPPRSGRRSAKYTTAFRNPSLLPVSWRTPSIWQP